VKGEFHGDLKTEEQGLTYDSRCQFLMTEIRLHGENDFVISTKLLLINRPNKRLVC